MGPRAQEGVHRILACHLQYGRQIQEKTGSPAPFHAGTQPPDVIALRAVANRYSSAVAGAEAIPYLGAVRLGPRAFSVIAINSFGGSLLR